MSEQSAEPPPSPAGDMKLTQHMTLHINGGNKFSELHYEIKADGQPTGITRHTLTNGRPKYLKTTDVLVKGDERFDILASKGVGMIAWIEARAK